MLLGDKILFMPNPDWDVLSPQKTIIWPARIAVESKVGLDQEAGEGADSDMIIVHLISTWHQLWELYGDFYEPTSTNGSS